MEASVETIGAAPGRVVHSVLSPTALLEAVARAYPIERPVACELLRLGMNDTYLLRTRRQRFVLRVYRAGWRSPEDVDYELALLAHLAVRGVPVSAAVPGDDGMLRLPVMAPEGPRMAALFGFALGEPLRWDDAAQSRLAGRLLGHVHAAADDFDGPRGRLQLDAEYLIDRPLADMRPFFETRPRDWLYLQGLGERLRARLTAAARDGLDWGPCHGDFTAVHLLVHREAVTILDFDLCGAGWRAYDLLPARWQALRHGSAALWDAFLHGYREARPLSDRDLASVPLFEALRHLWGLGLRTRELPVRGSSRLSPGYLTHRLAAFRRWELEHAVSAPPGRSTAPVLPVAYSILSSEALLDEVRREYAIDGLESCSLVQHGLNATYLVTGAGGRYVARLYGAGWRSAASIAYELELLGHLDAAGVSVALPIPARDHALARLLPAPEGPRRLVLFTFVEGSPLSWHEPAHWEAAGRAAAAFHAASDDFASRHSRAPLDLENLIEAQLDALRPYLERRPEWRVLSRIAADLRDRAAALTPGLDWGVCHGALAAENLRVGEDGKLSLIDFDFAAPGWRAYDLAAVHRVASSLKRSEIWDLFIRGYVDVRAPATANLQAVPLFHAIRRLWSLGIEARKAPALGSHRLGPEHLQPALRALRRAERAGRAQGRTR